VLCMQLLDNLQARIASRCVIWWLNKYSEISGSAARCKSYTRVLVGQVEVEIFCTFCSCLF